MYLPPRLGWNLLFPDHDVAETNLILTCMFCCCCWVWFLLLMTVWTDYCLTSFDPSFLWPSWMHHPTYDVSLSSSTSAPAPWPLKEKGHEGQQPPSEDKIVWEARSECDWKSYQNNAAEPVGRSFKIPREKLRLLLLLSVLIHVKNVALKSLSRFLKIILEFLQAYLSFSLFSLQYYQFFLYYYLISSQY